MTEENIDRQLRRRRTLARLAILFEAVWTGVWPALGLIGLFLCAALLELPQSLPPWPHAVLLALVGLGVVALLVHGLWRVRWPDRPTADRRLERNSGLAHRPLMVLTDRPAVPGADLLWQAHLARAAAQIHRLRVGWPKPGLAARDRRGLRGGLVVALAAALMIAGTNAPSRIEAALMPGFPPGTAAPDTLVQAWITPPAYTGVAPIFLKPDTAAVSLPAGSHLTVSVTGGSGQPSLWLDGRSQGFRPLDASSFQADRDLTVGGRLAVRRHGRDIAGWNLTVIADSPPAAAFTEPPGQAAHGLQTRLAWRATDDYGVVALQAEIRLRDRPDAPPVVLAIPLPGGAPKSAHAVALEDLTANPWAGLPVTVRLVARDALGQEGRSDDADLDLPERQFKHPVSRALVVVRKMLALRPDNRPGAIRELDRLSNDFDAFAGDLGAYLNLRDIASLLFRNPAPKAVDDAQARMWELALHMEETSTERTAQALERAREALHDAMQRDANGEHVDPQELDRLMRQLQQALAEHLQALAEQAQRDHTAPPQAPDGQRLDAKDLDRMAQEMRDAARDGRMDDAREKMAELEKMLDALKNARPQSGQRQNAQQRQRGRQQMGALQDMVQRQGGLLDHSQERAAANADPRQPQPDPSDDPEGQAQRQQEQRVQRALRRALGELMQQFGDLTGKIPPSLGEADSAMRDAGQALGQGNDAGAAAGEQKAIEALQKGGREMGQEMAKQFGRQPGQGQPGQQGEGEDADGDGDGDDGFALGGTDLGSGQANLPGPNRSGRDPRDSLRDPLGRLMQNGTGGNDQSADVQVPDQMEQARTRAIQEELRRRGSDRERPQQELDYIDRLLKQF
jgi:uncharacterized protein (TIGR02302 family)